LSLWGSFYFKYIGARQMEKLSGNEGKINGAIVIWYGQRGYGFVLKQNEDGTAERFYLHISKILKDQPRPKLGASVQFRVNPILEGPCPAALDVEVLSNPAEYVVSSGSVYAQGGAR
jgi:cold shock CspA family protein